MTAMYEALAKLYPSVAARLCRKHKHASRGAAEAHLRAMRKRDDTVVDPDALGVYECRKCGPGVWHTGHGYREPAAPDSRPQDE